jgi:hypothetical protein
LTQKPSPRAGLLPEEKLRDARKAALVVAINFFSTTLVWPYAEVCLALAHKNKELDTREFAYEFRTVAEHLERHERQLMERTASPIHGEHARP